MSFGLLFVSGLRHILPGHWSLLLPVVLYSSNLNRVWFGPLGRTWSNQIALQTLTVIILVRFWSCVISIVKRMGTEYRITVQAVRRLSSRCRDTGSMPGDFMWILGGRSETAAGVSPSLFRCTLLTSFQPPHSIHIYHCPHLHLQVCYGPHQDEEYHCS
jgi:hypothetical protein